MDSIYEQYAIIDSKIEDLKNQKDSLRTEILEGMVERGEEKTGTAVGKFSISKLKTWTYTDKVVELGEEFKACKAREESTGDATYVENLSLRFNKIKL